MSLKLITIVLYYTFLNFNMKQSRRIKIKIHEDSEEKCIQCQQKITGGSKIVEIEADAETEINKFYKPGKYHLLCLLQLNNCPKPYR